jgi:hypothetical protein
MYVIYSLSKWHTTGLWRSVVSNQNLPDPAVFVGFFTFLLSIFIVLTTHNTHYTDMLLSTTTTSYQYT